MRTLKATFLVQTTHADTRLDGATLSNAMSVDQAQTGAAWGDATPSLPDDCKRPQNERWFTSKTHETKRQSLSSLAARSERSDYGLAEAANGRDAEAGRSGPKGN